MPNLPLLVFPQPERAIREKRSMFPRIINFPNIDAQGTRLTPIFSTLQQTFDSRRVEVQQGIDGLDPEQVLVIEIIGNVADFSNAVKKIEGLEWLGEIEEDEIAPDNNFFDVKKPEKTLNGRLFLTMTNQRALNEMLSLWETYKEDTTIKFRKGLAKFKDVFKQLKDIRRWDVNDRMLETGILENWQFELEQNRDNIKFEIELWFRTSEIKRREGERTISALINAVGGRIIDSSIISEIGYHAILAELPAIQIETIVNSPNTELVKCDNVMFFRPTGQIIAGDTPNADEYQPIEVVKKPLPQGSPIVALFDGLPLANHSLLANRLIIDDPDGYEEFYGVENRNHGTAMSSLIVNGDLNEEEDPLESPLYVRPIMKPSTNRNTECVPNDVLFVDLIHRAVKRIFEGEDGFNAIRTIKIINISIGDPTRMFYYSLSPLAKVLDWLSFKYNVLFTISAGNHAKDISFDETYTYLQALTASERQNALISKIVSDYRNRRILSPSESINSITIGALHFDNSVLLPIENRINPSEMLFPSTISAFGNGYRRSIKPDMVFYGGRQFYEEPFSSNGPAVLRISKYKRIPGNKVAAPDSTLDKTVYERGTSNATALISRNAVFCHRTIQSILEQENILNGDEFVTLLIKSMLVHGCCWGDIQTNLIRTLNGSFSNAEIKNIVTRWIGYGLPDIAKVNTCTEQRVTILGYGKLIEDQVHIFKLPLPPSLSLRNDRRKLTITLAWFTPIATNTQKYRTASLYFEADNKKLSVDRDDADYNAVKRGTLQHEIFVGEQAIAFEDGENIAIKVTCKKDATDIRVPIPYALTVTLEVAEGIDIDIYEEVRTRISIPVAVPVN